MSKQRLSERQEFVFDFIQSKGEVEQSVIVDEIIQKYQPKDKNNARVTVSRILSSLKSHDLVKKREEKNEGAGGIYKNIWSVK